MEHINKFLDKNINKIFLIFLFLQPIIDVLTAVMLHVFSVEFTIGMFLRILFLGLMLYYIVFINKKSHKKALIYLLLIFIYIVLFCINILYTKGWNAFGYEFKNLIKSFYFPILLVIIYNLFNDKRNIIKPRLLKNLFIVYLLLVFIPNIFGIGFDSYEITKSGSIGYFYTANEISAILSILMPIFIYIILEKKNYYFIGIVLVILFYVLTSIGTKGPLLSFGIISLYYLGKYIVQNIKMKKYKGIMTIVGIFIIVIIAIYLLLPKTNFYKNIVTHLKFLEVEKVSDIITNPKVIDHFIFSQRLTFWNNTRHIYKNSNFASKLLGIGYIDNYATDQVSMKMVEMDYVDIFYRHGIIGFTIYIFSLVYMVVKILKKYFDYIKINHKNKIVQSYMLSLLLAIVLAMITGHVITAPSVAIYVALIINLLYNELYKGEPKYDKIGHGNS